MLIQATVPKCLSILMPHFSIHLKSLWSNFYPAISIFVWPLAASSEALSHFPFWFSFVTWKLPGVFQLSRRLDGLCFSLRSPEQIYNYEISPLMSHRSGG